MLQGDLRPVFDRTVLEEYYEIILCSKMCCQFVSPCSVASAVMSAHLGIPPFVLRYNKDVSTMNLCKV